MHSALLALALAASQSAPSSPFTPASPRVAVRGTAVDAKGAPIAGAGVMLYAGTGVHRADADSAGRFAIESIAAADSPAAWLEARGGGGRAFVVEIPASAVPIELGALVLLPTTAVKG